MENDILKIKKEKKSIIFYFSFIFLIGVLVSYFLLTFFIQKTAKEINLIQQKIQEEFSPEIRKLEKQIKEQETKIRDFTYLLERHNFPTKFLELIKKHTHPKVLLKNLTLNLEEWGINLVGESDNFSVLAQQISLLEQFPNLKDLRLEKVQITKEQKVEFLVKLFLFPEKRLK